MAEKYRKCVKCGASASQNPKLTFHSFPRAGKTDNYARVRLWAEYCFPGETFTEEKLKSLHKSHKLLCSNHFDRSAYTDDSMKRLNPNAIPVVLRPISPVPGPSQQSTIQENVPLAQQYIQPREVVPIAEETIPKSKSCRKCQKYINQIYKLRKSLERLKGKKKKGKLMETLSESEYFEKLNENLNPAFSLLLQSQLKNVPRKLDGRRWTFDQKSEISNYIFVV